MKSQRVKIVLLAIVLLATVLRLYKLNLQSVWLDEIHTLNEANPDLSLAAIYQSILASDQHPPLYFYIIHFLFKLFGYTPLVARAFSAVLGIAGVYALYRLGKEVFNKEVGLIAALLLSVNVFHLYHSQDARPYALLCFGTIFSFVTLVKFIRLPSLKNGIYYGLATTVMLYGHFFSLFTLTAQLLLLSFVFVLANANARKQYALHGVLAGAIIAILYIPLTWRVFQAARAIKSFWIQKPGQDVYTQIYKEFLGNNEVVLGLFSVAILLFFLKLAKVRNFLPSYDSILSNKVVFAFVLLSSWIVVGILIPLVVSHVSLPMIISRYFISVLPAVLLLVAYGFYQFRNRMVLSVLMLMVLTFSLVDIVVVKHYYTWSSKTQFREITQTIADRNTNHEPVVTSLPWYFPYFLQNKERKFDIVGKNLDDYTSEMAQDTGKVKNFWYVDAHSKPYKVSDATQQFLDQHFYVENSTELIDTWTKHYVRLDQRPTEINIGKYNPLKDENGDKIKGWLDKFDATSDGIEFAGWSFIEGIDADASQLTPVLLHEGKALIVSANTTRRVDITQAQGNGNNLDNSGFSGKILFDKLVPGTYRFGIYIKNNKHKKEGLLLTDRTFTKP